MAKLSEIDRQDLLAMANSASLRKDFEAMDRNRLKYRKKSGRLSMDEYIEFLSFVNSFANHARKPFHKIKGNNFKI